MTDRRTGKLRHFGWIHLRPRKNAASIEQRYPRSPCTLCPTFLYMAEYFAGAEARRRISWIIVDPE